jgi:hypothetical protein
MEYRLHYRKSNDDSQPETYETSSTVTIGDTIELAPGADLHYCVIGVHEFSDGTGCLDLWEPAASKKEARLLAKQAGQI